MKFSTREEIDAPIESVFAAITNFQEFESAARRRGATVQHLTPSDVQGLGRAWHLRFLLRGKERDANFEVTRFDPSTDLVVSLNSRNIIGAVTCELFELSPDRTRLTVAMEIRPLTLSARLLIQSLKIAKTRMTGKFKNRVAELASDIETQYRRQV